MNQRLLTALVLAAFGVAAQAKLPAPDDAAKAKAAEAAAKTAWQAKVDAYQLCKVQDKVAARYKAGAGKNGGKPAPAAQAAAKPASAAQAAAKPASAPMAVASSATAAASAPAAAASAAGTPVAYTPPPACADPGPFAYNPPEQKPLETSGAHSPAGNATSPPSVPQESATMAPAKPSTAPAGGKK